MSWVLGGKESRQGQQPWAARAGPRRTGLWAAGGAQAGDSTGRGELVRAQRSERTYEYYPGLPVMAIFPPAGAEHRPPSTLSTNRSARELGASDGALGSVGAGRHLQHASWLDGRSCGLTSRGEK